MRLELDDPRLMDYVLGELEDGEALSLAAALEQEENKEARELVEELRGVTEMTRRILHEEDPGVALSDEQRAAIVGTVENVVLGPRWWFVRRVVISAVACAVVILGIIPLFWRTMESKRAAGLERMAAIAEDQELVDTSYKISRLLDEGDVVPQRVLTEPLSEEERARLHRDMNSLNSSVAGSRGMGLSPAPPAARPALEAPSDVGDLYRDNAFGTSAYSSDEVPIAPEEKEKLRQEILPASPKPKPKMEPDPAQGNKDGVRDDQAIKQYTREPVAVEGTPVSSSASPNITSLESGIRLPEESRPAEEQWAEYNVGNLTGQTALPEQVASNHEVEGAPGYGRQPENNLWQWNTPTDKPTEIVGGPGTETYVKVAGVKPFVAVKDEPLSTFSIDVDTAAYSNVRRFLSQGQLPPADAVRIEEMINYFAYSYPQPTDGRPFAVAVHGAPAPWAPERQLVRIGVKGKEVPASERPPANLVFLLDVSGSMGDANKLPLVKESMKTLLSQLRPNDRVGIVTYAGDARQVLGSTPCGEAATITQAIDSLNSGGSTNGGGGIQMAYDLAQSNFIKEGINRVVMATDGDFNVGTTEHGDLMGLIEARAKSGVFLTTLGFGMGNLKDSTLEQLANRGNGNYAYIDNHAEARKALVDQLSGTLQTIAKDVKIQVEFNPAKVSHYRLLGYENRALANQDFNDDTKDAGEIGAGHTVTALYEIIPTGGTPVSGVDALKYQSTTPGVDALKYQDPAAPPVASGDVVEPAKPGFGGEERFAPEPIPTPLPQPMPVPAGEWLTVKMRYKQPEGNESTKIDVPLLAMNGDLRETDADFRFASAVAAFGQVLRNSGYRHSSNFDRIVELARGAANGDAEREAFVDLVITAKTLSTQNR